MGSHANIMSYFFQAGMVVKTVMFLLLIASVFSWTLILQRAWYFNRKRQAYTDFNSRFWTSPDLTKLYNELERDSSSQEGLAAIFYAGFKEFMRIRQYDQVDIEPIQRSMQISYAKESEALETHLPLFASIGSIAPYVGLFGTVWGIMTSFQALGNAQQATIAMVAPGISEALVATALGLFTAIPAVIAYNRYTSNANQLLNRYDLFQEELIALISQQTTASSRG